MSNAVFPTLASLEWPTLKIPMWSTQVKTAKSGRESRSTGRSFPIYKIKLSFSALKSLVGSDDLYTLVGFYNQRRGSFDSFLFSDPTDKTVTLHDFGTGNGSATKFQIIRTQGGFVDEVKNIVGTPLIYVNNVLQTVTTQYVIDAFGAVTFVTPPTNTATIRWSGSYYYRCRFESDENEFENFMKDLWQSKSVKMIGCLDNRI